MNAFTQMGMDAFNEGIASGMAPEAAANAAGDAMGAAPMGGGADGIEDVPLGAAEGEAFLFATQHAIENKQPLLVISCGGGAKMQESLISLSQLTRTTLAINELKSSGLPYFVLLTDPTAGGITASYAMLGDIHLAEPGALIAFAGARVIQGTVKEELPEGFQKSEYLQKTGFVDLIVERKDLAAKIGTLLSILLKKNSVISSEENETSEDSQSLTKAAS